jgi:membrane glycosyltransferase
MAHAPQPRRPPERPAERRIEVSPERLLQDWRIAHERAHAFLAALAVPEEDREELATDAIEAALRQEVWEAGGDAVSQTMRALRERLCERYPEAGALAALAVDGETAWRAAKAVAGAVAAGREAPTPPQVRGGRLCSMPPLERGHMVPDEIERRFFRRLFRRRRAAAPGKPLFGRPLRRQRRLQRWTRVARRRRLLLGVLVLIPSVIASGFMVNVLPHQGRTWLELAIVIFFGALFGWISIGFWTATLGFFTLVRRRDRFAITNLGAGETVALDAAVRTAVVMPICEEPVERVFAGLRAIHRSIERGGWLPYFDFFVLSDSSDPSTALREEEAWLRWCRESDGFRCIFYRRRKVRLKRKSGNVADFCRRWGRAYRYMIMLDADSVMSGDTLARLVYHMERNPHVGMIQTAPSAVNRRSLFARVQQFASRVYGPMFAAGLHFWQLGDGQYWGHNTIIRIEPFMNHCGLPRLPGKPPLGGEILSHDFVEAALMGRAGWSLWLAHDLGGSYEEVPSTLLEEMKRDRRWCQGNLQHLRLLFTEGLFGAHRALFLNGALSYVSALLWFGFLTLSTVEALRNVLAAPDYFPHGASLFPEWPVWRPDWALALLGVIGMLLFFPKFLSIALITLKQRNARAYGGVVRLTLSVLLEILVSSLFAPIRMVFHSRFVLTNLIGRTVTWRSQGREDAETSWREALGQHGADTLVASIWGATLFWLNPDYFWWVTPIVGALILSVPTSVLASRVRLGDRARKRKLFVIPEESAPPPELRDLYELHAAALEETNARGLERDGFVRATVDPYLNAVHRALLGARRSLAGSIRERRAAMLERALAQGPPALDARAKRILLADPDTAAALHRRVWNLSDRVRARNWGRPGPREERE